MKMTSVSTSSINNATREARTDLQIKLAEGQKEATTGRLADVGQTLGYLTERTISLRQDRDRYNSFKDSNVIAQGRLSVTQTTLQGVADNAQQFLSTLVAARAARSGAGVAVDDAKKELAAFTAAINSASNGAQLFSGINTDVKPVAEYYTTPASAAKTAVDAAFLGEFGVAQGATGTEAITAAQMQTFLDGDFADMFDLTSWSSTWSSASDQNISTRIADNERVETSANANEGAFRSLVSAYTMVADLGLETLSDGAYDALLDKAIAIVGQSIGDITQIRATLGAAEERIAEANTSMDLKIKIVEEHVTKLEAVDPYEAASHVNALLTQIETAYSLTARLQRLSLINFL